MVGSLVLKCFNSACAVSLAIISMKPSDIIYSFGLTEKGGTGKSQGIFGNEWMLRKTENNGNNDDACSFFFPGNNVVICYNSLTLPQKHEHVKVIGFDNKYKVWAHSVSSMLNRAKDAELPAVLSSWACISDFSKGCGLCSAELWQRHKLSLIIVQVSSNILTVSWKWGTVFLQH